MIKDAHELELMRLASTVTVEWLTERLFAYQGKPNTLRKVHSSWTQFFAYCTDVSFIPRSNTSARRQPGAGACDRGRRR